jgi:pimeloyl-ACP methyl ester carboxylesterase
MNTPVSASKSESITLADGRTLCFARWGAPGGKPVLYLHGAGSSRLDGEHYEAYARDAGVELFATDRPGCGGSSSDPRRNQRTYSYATYADDLRELADRLALARFVVAGMSNGGAYAMAAAARLGERVTCAMPINSTTPVQDPEAWRASSRAARIAYRLMPWTTFILPASMKRAAYAGDGILQRAAREALRQADSGYLAQEVRMIWRDWGFDPMAVTQPVEIFSGEQDAGHGFAPRWAQRLPRGRLHVIPGGHGDYGAPDSAKRIVAAMAAA